MKYILVLTVTLVFMQFINGVAFAQNDDDEEYNGPAKDIEEQFADYEDDADPTAGFDDDEEETYKPIYKIEDAPRLFKEFMKKHNKVYKNTDDRKTHYETFVRNLKEINRINSDKEYSSTVDINLFTDLSPEERQVYYGIPGK